MTTLCFFCTLFAVTTTAQDKLFTLEDLNFGGTNYHNLRPKNMFLTWWGDQLMYQDAEESGTIDKKGNKKPVFRIEDLGSDWHSAMNATYPYPAEPLVLLKNKKERVLYDFKKKQIVWRQTIGQQETMQDWNKQSKALAFKRDYQLFVRDAEGKEHQLTTDGSREIVYGEAVHRNEWGINEGLFWSPDGQRLAFYRMDQTMVTDYPQVNIDPRVAECEPDKYPMAGMESHKVTVGVFDLQTGETVYLATRTKPTIGSDQDNMAPELRSEPSVTPAFEYFTNIAWSPDSKTIYMQELTRDQDECHLVAYDAASGRLAQDLYYEYNSKYVEPEHPIQFLPWDSSKFIIQSQKDGYNHLYLFDLSKNEKQKTRNEHKLFPLTSGPWVVLDVLGFNEKTKSIIIASNEKHPLQRNLYAVNLKTLERTPLDNGEGMHRGVLSATGNQLYDKWNSPTTPNNVDVIQTANAKSTRLLTAPDPWEGYQQPGYLSGSIKAADGKTDLYYRMVVPKELYEKLSTDESNNKLPFLLEGAGGKLYPTIVYVYGGPHAHNVDASWHWYSRSWETYMAQKGYVLFILDNRGAENRGRDFEQATFHQLGQIEMQDQMKGVEFRRTLPYVDMNRLGVHGWSYGGYMTISLMTNYPDVFKVGVAGGPVIDWKWYEVMYGERYMGTPANNPDGYAKTSLISKADQLKGKLQIIIGYNDPTVVPQHALSFLKACIEAGTQPDFFVYPGEGHNMMGHSSVHLHERITQYFEDYLK